MGGRASRQKGNRREREMVGRLQALGLPSHRVPLSGALGGDYSGDLVVDLSLRLGGGPPLRAEVKGRAGAEGWRGLRRRLQESPFVVLTRPDMEAVAVTWEGFAGLVAGEGLTRWCREGRPGTRMARWATVRRWLGDNSLLFLVEDRAAPLVVLTWEVFARLVGGGKDGRAGFTGPACGAPAPPPGQ